jgi:hypothetical protein
VQTQLRPGRCERGEDLGSAERVAAVFARRCSGVASEQHEVVAGFADAEGEQLAGRSPLLHEAEGLQAPIRGDLRHAGPDQVHVDRQGGRGSRFRQTLLEPGDLRERASRSAELGRDQRGQVARGAEVGEVVVGERVVTVVRRGSRADALEELVVQMIGGVERVGSHVAILPLAPRRGVEAAVRSGS